MSEDLRKTMLHSAASRYGAEHYRAILFLHNARRIIPALALVVVVGALGWLLAPAAGWGADHPNVTGAVIVGGLILVGLITAVVRRVRSPYRRRRFR
jgi:hypothetical protein